MSPGEIEQVLVLQKWSNDSIITRDMQRLRQITNISTEIQLNSIESFAVNDHTYVLGIGI